MDKPKLETRLRIIMRCVNDLERASGVGGAVAETVQEQCNAIARDSGSSLRFGLGGENPVTPNAQANARPQAVALSEVLGLLVEEQDEG